MKNCNRKIRFSSHPKCKNTHFVFFLRGGRGSGFLPRFSSRFLFFMSFPPPPFLERSIQYCDSGFHHIFFCPLVLEETNQTVVRSSPPFNRERINNKTPKKIKVLFSCSPWFLTNPPLKNPTHTGAMSALFFACFVFLHIIRLEEKKTNTFDRLSKRSHGRRAHTGWGPFPILCKLFDTCSSVGNLNHLIKHLLLAALYSIRCCF